MPLLHINDPCALVEGESGLLPFGTILKLGEVGPGKGRSAHLDPFVSGRWVGIFVSSFSRGPKWTTSVHLGHDARDCLRLDHAEAGAEHDI
jgi:hypothetical protein